MSSSVILSALVAAPSSFFRDRNLRKREALPPLDSAFLNPSIWMDLMYHCVVVTADRLRQQYQRCVDSTWKCSAWLLRASNFAMTTSTPCGMHSELCSQRLSAGAKIPRPHHDLSFFVSIGVAAVGFLHARRVSDVNMLKRHHSPLV
jgi:hypothetical protein